MEQSKYTGGMILRYRKHQDVPASHGGGRNAAKKDTSYGGEQSLSNMKKGQCHKNSCNRGTKEGDQSLGNGENKGRC